MSQKILYFDCFSGISGDMAVGALLDLGCDGEALKQAVQRLGLEERIELSWGTVNRGGITATKFDVDFHLDGSQGEGHSHAHHHRSHREIATMIQQSDLEEGAKRRSLAIFAKIAEAESKIHGVPVAEVHFHEVGAVDSIVDIVGISVLLEMLAPDRVIASPVVLGSGRIKTMHGLYPVPAPATLEILRGAPVEAGGADGELTTPTGAGVLAASADGWGALPDMEISAIGYGAGSKELPGRPDVLRVVLGTKVERPAHRDAGHEHHHDH